MKLLIVESPSKAKTIEKYLDGEYRVVASVGHVRDLPKSNKKAIDILGGFIPHYEISPGKEKVVSELRSLAKKATEILLATDPDREGEAIAWHVAETCGLKKPRRVLFYEITPEAVKEAILHPRTLDTNLRRAQEARRVLDRLVGYDLSGLIWKKVRYGLSAGRVQSPALHILVEREKEIRAFIPELYFHFTGHFLSAKNKPLLLTYTTLPRPKSEEGKVREEADTLISLGQKSTWKILDVKETPAQKNPYPPFTTSTLQQAASSRLGLSPSMTMRLAQKLYEAGHISYMRTDSVNLNDEVIKKIGSLVTKESGGEYHEERRYKTKSKNAQEAHEAIRPTHPEVKQAGTGDGERKLYALIRTRTIASQMAPAKVLRTKVTAVASDASVPNFSATGSVVLFPGWYACDSAARGEDSEFPQITVGETLTLKTLTPEEKWTTPPNRYSEAGLVKELEKRGIGRPSTYASIIKTIQDRGYVEKEGKALSVTDTGMVVDDFLVTHFAEILSDVFTADMESKLDDIANGDREYEKTLKEFYTPFAKEVKSKDKIDKVTNMGDAPTGTVCPKCGKDMVVKLAKNGKFLSCSNFPECTGARTIDGVELEGPKETGEACPECKDGKLLERDGRFGRFIACSNYPKCKHIKNDPNLNPTTGVKCPMCGDGEMQERRGRFGVFYSCTNYPKCKNAIKAKPTGNICHYLRDDKDNKECGALMMTGTKTIPERCSDKTCPNHRPDKLEKK